MESFVYPHEKTTKQTKYCSLCLIENEARPCRESGSYDIVENANEHPKTSFGCSLSRAGWQVHAERNRFWALADNVGRHEVVSGLASQPGQAFV